jgi:peptide-methionine (S)-S-oxide reductase
MSEKIVLGGGCFWCTEAMFKRLEGVINVKSGYTGGETKNPNYESVSKGNTGHAEVIEVEFDTKRISLEELLDVFWKIHDPTTQNRQGHDEGSQYRSIILYESEDQKKIIERSLAENSKKFENPIVTEIKKLDKFWLAEGYHQNYFENNKNTPYCQVIISPKLRYLESNFGDKLSH